MVDGRKIASGSNYYSCVRWQANRSSCSSPFEPILLSQDLQDLTVRGTKSGIAMDKSVDGWWATGRNRRGSSDREREGL